MMPVNRKNFYGANWYNPSTKRIEDRRHGAQARSCTGLNGHMDAQDEQRIDEPSRLSRAGYTPDGVVSD
ncbi:MAG: hypothetical protein LBF65_01480 [Holosporales bacterium]|nr:hypothetical protein [Holosporales bacterium]